MRDVELAGHAAGAGLDQPVGGVGEAEAVEQLAGAGPGVGARTGPGCGRRARGSPGRSPSGRWRASATTSPIDVADGVRVGGARRCRRPRPCRSPAATSVVRILTVVDLPAPLGPSRAKTRAGADVERQAVERADRRRAAAAGIGLDEVVGREGVAGPASGAENSAPVRRPRPPACASVGVRRIRGEAGELDAPGGGHGRTSRSRLRLRYGWLLLPRGRAPARRAGELRSAPVTSRRTAKSFGGRDRGRHGRIPAGGCVASRLRPSRRAAEHRRGHGVHDLGRELPDLHTGDEGGGDAAVGDGAVEHVEVARGGRPASAEEWRLVDGQTPDGRYGQAGPERR